MKKKQLFLIVILVLLFMTILYHVKEFFIGLFESL